MAATPIESVCMPHQCDGALIGVRSMQLPPGRVLSKQVHSLMGPAQLEHASSYVQPRSAAWLPHLLRAYVCLTSAMVP